MKTTTSLMVLALALLALPGCGSVYTNIEKTADNTYLVTRVKNGFFNVSGTLYRCTASAPTKMTCEEIGSP